MIAYFADGPLNGQRRELPDGTPRWRVPLMEPFSVDYWEVSDLYSPTKAPNVRVGYYEPANAYLDDGARIYVYQGIER
jgi:hypothetical protein